MSSRRSFLRTAVAALMAQWIKIPELKLDIETPQLLVGSLTYFKNEFSLGFAITQKLIDDDLYEISAKELAEIAGHSRWMYEPTRDESLSDFLELEDSD